MFNFKAIDYLIISGVVTNSSDDLASYESSLDLNKLKKSKKKLPAKEKLNLDKVKMSFECEWEECDYKSSYIIDYFRHVSEHVDFLWVEEWQGNKESKCTKKCKQNVKILKHCL